MPLFYHFANFLVKVALIALTRREVRGREYVPRQGPLIVVANHINFIDPPFLSASIPRRITFMAKMELYNTPWMRLLLSAVGAFPVRRGRLARRALRHALSALAQGEAIGIFPEGTRSQNRQMQPAQPGAALIALQSGAPILPVGISGSERVRGVLSVLRRPRIVVNIGHPFQLPAIAGKTGASELNSHTELIMAHIAALLPASYRGPTRPRQRERRQPR